MKITCAPSKPQESERVKYFTVSVESPHDDLNAEEMMEMFRQLMLAAGFAVDTVKEALGE